MHEKDAQPCKEKGRHVISSSRNKSKCWFGSKSFLSTKNMPSQGAMRFDLVEEHKRILNSSRR